MSVYRVIDIIGTSPSSWENAAAEAIHRTKQTIDDIRVAQFFIATVIECYFYDMILCNTAVQQMIMKKRKAFLFRERVQLHLISE